jgi:[acyl-carrier-protein] S-malonyltransferase
VDNEQSEILNLQSSIAFLFPGQGSQYAGMGKELAENFPAAKQVFEEADEALSFSISRLCFEGPEEDLQLTENTQPAILSVSVAAFRAIQTHGSTCAGFCRGTQFG